MVLVILLAIIDSLSTSTGNQHLIIKHLYALIISQFYAQTVGISYRKYSSVTNVIAPRTHYPFRLYAADLQPLKKENHIFALHFFLHLGSNVDE
jgi:hypothetical protein